MFKGSKISLILIVVCMIIMMLPLNVFALRSDFTSTVYTFPEGEYTYKVMYTCYNSQLDYWKHEVITSSQPLSFSGNTFTVTQNGTQVHAGTQDNYNGNIGSWSFYSWNGTFDTGYTRNTVNPNNVTILSANYSIGGYVPAELNINSPIENETYQEYPNIDFDFSGHTYVEVALYDNNIEDIGSTPIIEDHVYTWPVFEVGTHIISQAQIPYKNTSYRVEFSWSDNGSDYTAWHTVNFTINRPEESYLDVYPMDGVTYQNPVNIVVKSKGKAPYNILVNGQNFKSVLKDNTYIFTPGFDYSYTVGLNTLEVKKPDGTVLYSGSFTFLRDRDGNDTGGEISNPAPIDTYWPNRSDYTNDLWGELQYQGEAIKATIAYPFVQLGNLITSAIDKMNESADDMKDFGNVLAGTMSWLPGGIGALIPISFVLIIILRVLKR